MQDSGVKNSVPCKALILTQLTAWCVSEPRSPKGAESGSCPTPKRLANSCAPTCSIVGRLLRHVVRCSSPNRRGITDRSEEHTSELQSHSDLVCRLLLEKKKKQWR